MSILLPAILNTRNYSTCLSVADQIMKSQEGVVQLDAHNLMFVDPFGLSLLASVGTQIHKKNKHIEIINLHPSKLSYLYRMDLLNQPWIRAEQMPTVGRNNMSHALVELKNLSDINLVDRYANQIAEAIVGGIPQLDKDEPPDEMTGYKRWDKVVEPLCHIFTELLNNALTHGRRQKYSDSSVWISAQYFQSKDKICIGIVDDGCGILGSLYGHEKLISESDTAAIMLALQPRVSCNREVGLATHTNNAGIGLTTSYRIAKRSNGEMLIVSGRSGVDVDARRNDFIAENLPKWQGTALSITLNRSQMEKINIRDLMPPREIPREPPSIRFE